MTDTLTDPIQNGEAPERLTLGGRLMNVFTSPGEVFEEVKAAPYETANWLVPVVCAAVAGIVFVMVVFSQPQIQERQRQELEARMEKQFKPLVDKGTMTRQQADQQIEKMEDIMSPTFYKVLGILASIFIPPVFLLAVALTVWLLGVYLFKGFFTYAKAMEIAGLATMVTVPGSFVSMFLAIIYGSIFKTPGPILLVGAFDPHNRVHILLSALNVFSLWYVALVAVGLSRLSGAGLVKSALWVFGIWAVMAIAPGVIYGGGPK